MTGAELQVSDGPVSSLKFGPCVLTWPLVIAATLGQSVRPFSIPPAGFWGAAVRLKRGKWDSLSPPFMGTSGVGQTDSSSLPAPWAWVRS